MEHAPWIGEHYQAGIDGTRLLLFGFSHYGKYDDGHDDADFTNYVVRRWAMTGEVPFFNAIASYFGFDDAAAFLPRIAFANTLPRSVGDPDDKFSPGDDAARDEVPARVRRIIDRTDPEKVIVFTAEGWQIFPAFDDREQDGLLPVAGRKPIPFGGYRRPRGGLATAYGLRHPLFAPWQMMHDSVTAIMAAR